MRNTGLDYGYRGKSRRKMPYNLTMMPAANKKMVLFEFTMISVANNGLLPAVSEQDISKFSDALFSANKIFVLDKICCVFCTLRVCYEDNLRNALKSSQCEAEEGN